MQVNTSECVLADLGAISYLPLGIPLCELYEANTPPLCCVEMLDEDVGDSTNDDDDDDENSSSMASPPLTISALFVVMLWLLLLLTE